MSQVSTIQPDLFAPHRQHDVDADSRAVRDCLAKYAELGRRWVLGKDIVEALGWPDHENSRRRLRSVAETNSKAILSGDKGYALLSTCTPDEINHAANRLRSQGERMIQRSVDIRAAYHRYGAAA